jgi:short-subunit dehydrogenase
MTSSSLYSTTKHAVVALSEALHGQLRLAGSSIEVAVLCPGAVNTNLARNSGRQRPAEGKPGAAGDLMAGYRDTVRTRMAAGQAPAAVAEDLFAGLARGDFYIVPGEGNAGVETRCQNLRARRVEDYAKSYPQFQ